MDLITIITSATSLFSTGGFVYAILTLKAERKKQNAIANQEEVKVSKEEATAFQEWQKVYKDMVSDNEQFRKNLMDEFKKMEEKLDLYVKQCSFCPNNKIK